MDNKIYNKFIQEVSKLQMTRQEKDRVFRAVLSGESTENVKVENTTQPVARVKSPWNIYTVRSWIHIHKTVSVAVAIIIIISLGGGGVVSASERSLPGDTLYPVKVSVVEPVKVALRTSPEAKAIVQSNLVNKRLEEVETLSVRDQLDEDKTATLERLIDEHTEDFSNEIDKVRVDGNDDIADDISISLQAKMNAHAMLIEKLEDGKDTAQVEPARFMAKVVATEAVSVNTEKVSLHSKILERASRIKIKSEKGDSGEDDSSSAFASGEAVSDVTLMSTSSVEPEKEVETSSSTSRSSRVSAVQSKIASSSPKNDSSKRYDDKKKSIEDYIESTKSKIERASSVDGGSLWKKEIVDDSNSTLNDALESLKLAEEHEKNGESEEAYSDLRRSERSTGQAETLIKSGLKIKNDDKGDKDGDDGGESNRDDGGDKEEGDDN